ncbi:hypothetical protein niasHT_012381 [Heterodera trifolii]|uniref:Uncharacterized protein n=1 Tax=Heterodera trifolii TaxID=157864 RepID=A0ABD2L2S1_9BILA
MLICAYVGKLDRIVRPSAPVGEGQNEQKDDSLLLALVFKKLISVPKQSRASRPASRKRTARVETEPKPMLSMPFTNPKQAEPTSRKSTDRAEPKPRPRKPFTNLTQAEPTSRKPTARAETGLKTSLTSPEQAKPTSRKPMARAETEPKSRLKKPFTNPTQAEPASRKPMARERKRNRDRPTR